MSEMPALTVAEQAIIDFQRGKEAMARRARQLTGDPAVPTVPADHQGVYYDPETLDALACPVRIEISFEDPLKTREQLSILAAAIVDAQIVTQQHELGIARQRLRLRETMKTAADMLLYVRGKAPSGRRRPGVK